MERIGMNEVCDIKKCKGDIEITLPNKVKLCEEHWNKYCAADAETFFKRYKLKHNRKVI
jgi:hypothetical protein